jgi:hypothetical protein
MKVSMTHSVMLAKRRKVMIWRPGLATCWALVVHTRRAVSLITMPATKDQLLLNETAFFMKTPFKSLKHSRGEKEGWPGKYFISKGRTRWVRFILKGNNLASDQKQVIPTTHLPKPVDHWLPSTNIIIYVRQKNCLFFYFQFQQSEYAFRLSFKYTNCLYYFKTPLNTDKTYVWF